KATIRFVPVGAPVIKCPRESSPPNAPARLRGHGCSIAGPARRASRLGAAPALLSGAWKRRWRWPQEAAGRQSVPAPRRFSWCPSPCEAVGRGRFTILRPLLAPPPNCRPAGAARGGSCSPSRRFCPRGKAARPRGRHATPPGAPASKRRMFHWDVLWAAIWIAIVAALVVLWTREPPRHLTGARRPSRPPAKPPGPPPHR